MFSHCIGFDFAFHATLFELVNKANGCRYNRRKPYFFMLLNGEYKYVQILSRNKDRKESVDGFCR